MLVNIGYGNMVMSSTVVATLSPASAPLRRLKDDVKERNVLIDAAQVRRMRPLIITDRDHVVLSAVQGGTLTQRFSGGDEA